jgi:hypothetical protein
MSFLGSMKGVSHTPGRDSFAELESVVAASPTHKIVGVNSRRWGRKKGESGYALFPDFVLRAQECRAAAISALANLSACEALKAGVVAAGGPTAIGRCLRHKEDGAVRQAAARAAANLTYHYPAATEAMVAGGGGAALVPLLRSTVRHTTQRISSK